MTENKEFKGFEWKRKLWQYEEKPEPEVEEFMQEYLWKGSLNQSKFLTNMPIARKELLEQAAEESGQNVKIVEVDDYTIALHSDERDLSKFWNVYREFLKE